MKNTKQNKKALCNWTQRTTNKGYTSICIALYFMEVKGKCFYMKIQ